MILVCDVIYQVSANNKTIQTKPFIMHFNACSFNKVYVLYQQRRSCGENSLQMFYSKSQITRQTS